MLIARGFMIVMKSSKDRKIYKPRAAKPSSRWSICEYSYATLGSRQCSVYTKRNAGYLKIYFFLLWLGKKKKPSNLLQSFEHWLPERKDKVNQNFERIWDCEESLINFSCKGSKKGSHLPSQSAM